MRFNLHFTHWSLLFITLISSCFLFYVVASENAKYVTTKQTETDATMASAATTTPPSADITSYDSLLPATHIDANIINAGDLEEESVDIKENRKDQTINILPNYKKIKKIQSLPQPPTPAAEHNEHNSNNNAPSDNLEGKLLNSPQHTTSTADSDQSNKSDNEEIDVDTVVENSKVMNTNENIMVGGDNKNHIHSSLDAQYAGDVGEDEGGGDSGNKIVNQQVPKGVESETRDNNVGGVDAINDLADDNGESLPDITDIPTVTVTELPLEILKPPQNSLDSVIIAADVAGEHRPPDERVNRTVDIIVNNEEEMQKDGQIVKINDSSGVEDTDGIQTSTASNMEADEPPNTATSSSATNIPVDAKSNDTMQHHSTHYESLEQQNANASSSPPSSPSTKTEASQVNLTTEEVPMPVFSEWAQKQMEAAEKQEQQQQEQTFNNSAQRKNNTNGNGKPPTLKIRAKNYASPDCGAKIIASSAYTSNAGAVLSASKDEYMLSLCGNRIWFVVELCEAIQAQKIDFANFELYSSSPQNFTVAVSKRFPTREWSNVGRFIAEDKRAVQGFDLHPHLFGKFVRVDIHSHYSKEHFCTLSLFRVFGTSEFEAFETENHPNDDLDDFDDEDLQEQNNVKNSEQNLFKSASDAVLSIVKKATELVGKPSNNQNQTFKTAQHTSVVCRTPVYGLFSCAECSSSLVERVNNALSCEFSQLNSLISIADIRNDFLNTRVCTKRYGIETKPNLGTHKDIRQSFYVNILPNDYVGALCQLLATPKTYHELTDNTVVDNSENETSETSANQTMEKKFGKEDLELLDKPEKKLMKPEIPVISDKSSESPTPELAETSTDIPLDDNQQQLPRPLDPKDEVEVTTVSPPKNTESPSIPDKNIFNVPAEELIAPPAPDTVAPEQQPEDIVSTTSAENLEQTSNSDPTVVAAGTTALPPKVEVVSTTPQPVQPKSEEDSNSWDNIESLLTSTPSSTMPAGGSAHSNGVGAAAGGFINQKLSNGGPQTESVFIRLSNRIKALERNMSLSGQYLEELSRRYKKQVEELQQTLTQQIQTVRTLEEQNRRHNELEELYAQRNTQLKHELDDLTLQVHACIVVIIFVGAFVFLVLMVGILFYRSLRRDTKEVLALYGKGEKKKTELSNTASVQLKLNRRKSFEDFSDHQQRRGQDNIECISGNEKLRRPSEEAMLILKDCKGDSKIIVGHVKAGIQTELDVSNNGAGPGRQRKISVCYGSNNNINSSTSGLVPLQTQKSIGGGGGKQRKGEKHSWPNTAQAQLLARQHLEQLNNEEIIGDAPEISSVKSKFQQVAKSKKKKDFLRRQESSPAENTNILNNTSPTDLNEAADFDEKLMLDEDDLDNFIPNADLAYNEFMPDGPRGYQCVASQANATNPASKKLQLTKYEANSKKARRLSSPVFFKSPFTKSLKGKITSSKSNPPHESTSWEWYRLKKSSSANGPTAAVTSTTTNAFLRVSPNASLDSSSLSEINFPTNSTENSFRILEEAILSSGESAITTATTGSSSTNGGNSRSGHRSSGGGSGGNMIVTSGISSSSNSNRSSSSTSSSTQSKKKNRSFNKIFRKVF